MASPGLGALGMGVMGVASGAYNTIEISAILVGILVVAVAGIFTIRSNVAKIWREQAEGEKARNEEMRVQMAEFRVETAAHLADVVKEHAAALAELQRSETEQRELKHAAQAELAAANMRTDLTPCLQLLNEILLIVRAGPLEVTGEGGGPVKVEDTNGG